MFSLAVSLVVSLGWLLGHRPSAEIVFAGDAMQHSAQLDAARRPGGVYDYKGCFDEVADYIEDADFAVVNLEVPLGGRPYTGYPCFSAPDSYADALVDAGFDLLLTANNHTLDRHDRGLVRTINRLDSIEVPHIGTYFNLADRSSRLPYIADINGIKVGFLNYTYGTNGIELRTDAVVDYIDRNVMADDISALRDAGAELICVCPHWGVEYRLLPEQSQRSLTDFLVEQGADMIIGGHPHVIQPMELRERPDGRKVAVVYSLGNFISNMKTRDTRGGAMARVSISRDEHGHACVTGLNYSLVFTEPPEHTGGNFRLVPAEESTDPRSREFVRSALGVYDRHNSGVGRDSIGYWHRRIPRLRLPQTTTLITIDE